MQVISGPTKVVKQPHPATACIPSPLCSGDNSDDDDDDAPDKHLFTESTGGSCEGGSSCSCLRSRLKTRSVASTWDRHFS
mmetsp:Transcript_13166/g.40506  ORF Transcript_13166/g.40506 Transcript_13166/m.40506 type:complete len:80 (+) Transcript_13166:136-375(+)